MKMLKIKWTRKDESTMIAPLPSGRKEEVKPNGVIEVEESIAKATVHAYKDWVLVGGEAEEKEVKKAKKKDPAASKKMEVETQDVKKEDVQKA